MINTRISFWRITRTLALIFAFVLLVPAVLVVSIYFRALYGSCVVGDAPLSDQEKIDEVIEYILRQDTTIRYVHGESKDYPLVQYESAEDFKSRNPDCCQVIPSSGVEKVFVWLGVLRPTTVRITYVERYLDDGGVRHEETVVLQDVMNSCGVLLNYP